MTHNARIEGAMTLSQANTEDAMLLAKREKKEYLTYPQWLRTTLVDQTQVNTDWRTLEKMVEIGLIEV